MVSKSLIAVATYRCETVFVHRLEVDGADHSARQDVEEQEVEILRGQ